jgi:hypothetical protein
MVEHNEQRGDPPQRIEPGQPRAFRRATGRVFHPVAGLLRRRPQGNICRHAKRRYRSPAVPRAGLTIREANV